MAYREKRRIFQLEDYAARASKYTKQFQFIDHITSDIPTQNDKVWVMEAAVKYHIHSCRANILGKIDMLLDAEILFSILRHPAKQDFLFFAIR